MAFLGRAARRVAPALRAPRAPSARTGARSYSSEPTKEKNVPYERTLKPEGGSSGPSKPLPRAADVVVVGGGSLGCQTLYHLVKMGLTNAVLLERDRLTAGTTWHTAGLLWQLRPSDVEVELLAHTRKVVSQDLEAETGLHTGWIQNGGLFIASNRQRLDEYPRLMSLGKVYGIESHVLSPAETKDLYPLMNVDDLYGTLYVPKDGTMDPAGTCTTLSRAASAGGATVGRRGSAASSELLPPATSRCPSGSGDRELPCDGDPGGGRRPGREEGEGCGDPPRDHRDALCGQLCRRLGYQAGADGRGEGAAGRHASRLRGDRENPGNSEHAQRPGPRCLGVPASPRRRPVCRRLRAQPHLLGRGDDAFTVLFRPRISVVPSYPPLIFRKANTARVKAQECVRVCVCVCVYHWLCCVFSLRSPTNSPSASSTWTGTCSCSTSRGPSTESRPWSRRGSSQPSVDQVRTHTHTHTHTRTHTQTGSRPVGDVCVCAESFTADHKPLMGEAPEVRGFFLGCGFNSAGMMLGGGCGRELAHWIIHGRPERDMYGYDIRAYETKKNVNYRYQELLGREYTFDFPPHHDVVRRRGPHRSTKTSATVTPPALGASASRAEHGVAVFDMSYFGKFYLTGPDAKKAADWLFTADVNKKPGDAYYLAIGGGVAEHNWNHIQTVLQDQGLRCQLADHSEDMGMISIQGPKRQRPLVDRLWFREVYFHLPPAQRSLLGREVLQEVLDADLSNDAFPFSTHKVVSAAGHQVRAMRLSFVGELGWELHIPKDACLPVYHAVMAAGAKHGIINSGYRAIDSLSIEKGQFKVYSSLKHHFQPFPSPPGYRHWHADLRPDDTPLEAGLAFTCKMKTSIPFQGRDRLEKQKEEGLKRRIVCFTIDESVGTKIIQKQTYNASLGSTWISQTFVSFSNRKVPMFGLEAIFRNGVPVGHLRRSDYGFFIDKTIGYGYIRNPDGGVVSAEFIKSGEFSLERMGVTYKAKAHLKTPFDPENKRVKGIYD
ncbi:unnamed protein product, partial [Tetraodon nigroviridis]